MINRSNQPISNRHFSLWINAAITGDLNMLGEILNATPHILDKQSSGGGNTALIKAAKAGQSAVVKFLVQKGANLSIRNKDGKNAKDQASNHGHREIHAFLTDPHAEERARSYSELQALRDELYRAEEESHERNESSINSEEAQRNSQSRRYYSESSDLEYIEREFYRPTNVRPNLANATQREDGFPPNNTLLRITLDGLRSNLRESRIPQRGASYWTTFTPDMRDENNQNNNNVNNNANSNLNVDNDNDPKSFRNRLEKIKYDGDIPDEYLCPVMQHLMNVPIATPSGHTYDLSTLKDLFKNNQLTMPCPLTRVPLSRDLLKSNPNIFIKNKIDEFVTEIEKKHKEKNEPQKKKAIKSKQKKEAIKSKTKETTTITTTIKKERVVRNNDYTNHADNEQAQAIREESSFTYNTSYVSAASLFAPRNTNSSAQFQPAQNQRNINRNNPGKK